MSNQLHQSNKHEIIVPCEVSECVERIRALRLTRPSPHSRYHQVRITPVDAGEVEFVVRSRTPAGAEQAHLTGYLTSQSNSATHVKIEARIPLVAKLALIGLPIYGLIAFIFSIYSPESIPINVGVGLLYLIGYLVSVEMASSSRYVLIDLVLEQLQETDPLKIPPDYTYDDPDDYLDGDPD